MRCDAKGSFLNSSVVKQWADDQFVAGCNEFVMDLELCVGMDSTFMGNLVDIAMKATRAGGVLQIAEASEKCVNLLEGLGVASLMEINPTSSVWEDCKTSIRENLVVVESSGPIDKVQHVFETHKKLCEADRSNEDKFNTVLDCLQEKMADRKR